MREAEWLNHGPASINLLLDRQAERDKLDDYRAGLIASIWVKDATPGSFFPSIKEDEVRHEKLSKIERVKATIANAKRKRKLGSSGAKGA
jgi:alkaline phosphatase